MCGRPVAVGWQLAHAAAIYALTTWVPTDESSTRRFTANDSHEAITGYEGFGQSPQLLV